MAPIGAAGMVLRRLILGVVFCCFGGVGVASALTTSEFSETTEDMQAGYVYGIMEYMSHVNSSTDPSSVALASSYLECFADNKIGSRVGLNVVKRYIDRTPDASTTPMLGNVMKALWEACKRYMPK
jgi:hypothetical protein